MSKAPFILLVNPWITDFAAHDLWSKPLGLLSLGALLRDGGCGVALIDCVERHDPFPEQGAGILPGTDRAYGTGKFPRTPVEKPTAYREIPRRYYRFGIQPESLRRKLRSLPRPDLIWVTSIMTYWYPGIRQTVEILREVFPGSPLWLGGIYARLCPEHAAATSGVDEVVTLAPALLPAKLEAATGFRVRNTGCWDHLRTSPFPALDLLDHPTYAPLLTSVGCPFGCPYCASGILQPEWQRRNAGDIYHEILHWHHRLGIADFAFYDDALLLQAETTLRPALERLVREGCRLRFHTPNAVHVRALSPDWCRLLYESGFTTLRLGLETTRPDRQREWGGKVENEMFLQAVKNLLGAGFSREQLGVYLLCGLPGQTPEEVAETIRVVARAGAQPYLCEYSPVPGTAMWKDACAVSPYDLAGEPLYHNNTFFACRRLDFTYEDLLRLKDLNRAVRRAAPGEADAIPPGSGENAWDGFLEGP